MRTGRLFSWRPWRGLSIRVITLVVVAVLATGGITGALLIQHSRNVIRSDAFGHNLGAADLAGSLAASFVEGAEVSLQQLALRPLFIDAVLGGDMTQAEWHMRQVMQTDRRFDNIVVYTPDGTGWASGLGSEWQYRGGSVSDREWFQQVVAGLQPYLGIPVLSRGTGNPVVTYVAPMFDDSGELRAILAGGIGLEALASTITGIRVSESTRASLLDSRQGGITIADENRDLILKPVSVPDEASSRALAGGRGALEASNANGKMELAAFAPVTGLPWSVVIREPSAIAFASVGALVQRALLVTLAVLLVALVAGVFLARRVTRPLRRLADGAAEVGKGNLDYRLNMVRGDEVGLAAGAFDHMAAELKSTLVSRDELAEQVVERRHAEESLAALAARQQAILSAVPDIIMEVDERKVYTWSNQEGFEFFGEDVIGKEAAFYFEGEQDTYEVVESLFADREDLMYVEGNVTGALSSALDITERRRAEEALRERDEQLRQSQKMEAVGQLAGGIAHDFNNLLTAIIGYSDLLLSDEQIEGWSQKSDIEEIRRAAERASALTRQILAFSRRQALRPEVVSLNEVLAGMEPLLRRTLGEHVDLVSLQHHDLGHAEIDVHQFEQVLMNLALNARDAMPSGGRLTLETANVQLDEEYCSKHPEAVPGSCVMLAVSDDGIGMDEATRDRVFEPFFTTKNPGEGTGLGLAMVYGIVKQSRGNIFVYSEPRKGTTFKIYLPRIETGAKAERQELPVSVSVFGSETVMVVEDESALCALIARVLGKAGYEVLTYASADAAADALDVGEVIPDLLLTDVVLPGALQGKDLVDRALSARPDLPVLYMSGYTRNAIVHAGRLDEGVNFLEKPFTPEALARMVRQVLDQTGAAAQEVDGRD
jgi:two-component system cell cycle sensor histidine kinase/response regulator CckA